MATWRKVSTQAMLAQCDGLRDTGDLTQWEEGFLENVINRWLLNGKRTDWLSEKQTEIVEKIWEKHFG